MIDRTEIKKTLARQFEQFRAEQVQTGLLIVTVDMQDATKVLVYGAHLDELRLAGATILAISLVVGQVGMIEKKFVHQFYVTYQLPPAE